jgi:hypothetical protein
MKKIYLFLSVLLWLDSSGAWSQQMPVTLFRVNAGGRYVTDSLMNWTPDTKKHPSVYLSDFSPNYTSGGTTWRGVNTTGAPNAIFGPNRYGATTWHFPVSAGEYYRVALYFAESPYASGVHTAGERLFEVYINDELVLDNFDIYATAGLDAVRRSFIVQAPYDSLYISLRPEQGSLRSPQVNGIEIETAPVLLPAPFNISSETYVDSVVLHWQDTSLYKTGFEIYRGYFDEVEQIEKFYLMGSVDANTATFTDTTLNNRGPCPPIYWVSYKIRTIHGSDASTFEYYMTGSFDVLPVPPSPIAASVQSSGEIRLSFVDDVTYAYSYEVYRAGDRNGPYDLIAELSDDEHYCSGDTLLAIDSDVLPDTTYYYYVQSMGAFHAGLISDTLVVTTPPEANIALQNRATIKVYPNPAEKTIFVHIDNVQEREVYIEITDKVGLSRYRTKKQLEDGKVELDLFNLETGVYILHVTSGSGKESLRFVKR